MFTSLLRGTLSIHALRGVIYIHFYLLSQHALAHTSSCLTDILNILILGRRSESIQIYQSEECIQDWF